METETTPTTPPAKRKRRASTPRAKKQLDPGIAAINERRNLEVIAYRSEKAAENIYNTFVNKRLDKLTPKWRQALFDLLSNTEKPSLLDVNPADAMQYKAAPSTT